MRGGGSDSQVLLLRVANVACVTQADSCVCVQGDAWCIQENDHARLLRRIILGTAMSHSNNVHCILSLHCLKYEYDDYDDELLWFCLLYLMKIPRIAEPF